MTGDRPSSAIYAGHVWHHRVGPPAHGFRYPLVMLLLDLDELPQLSRTLRLFGWNSAAPVAFRDGDHLGNPGRPVLDNLRAFIEARRGHWPGGPVRLLTHARIFGYVFNPVSIFYCFDPGGATAGTIVAEVNNTYGERHGYLLDARNLQAGPGAGDETPPADVQRRGGGRAGVRRWHAKKAFHVSPFKSLDGTYEFQLAPPDDRLDVRIDLTVGGARRFSSHLAMRRRPLTDAGLTRMLLSHPLMTLQVTAAIHWEAFRLWRKGVPFRGQPPYDPAAAERETLA